MQSLEKTTATRRHIILLTDGWSRSGQYDQILAKMKADGITLSTVGAGGGANPFLAQLAAQGGGRYYAAANPASIPDIFLKETEQVAGQQIIEEPFFPIQTSSSPILRGLDQGFPQLLGYNGTTAKSAAQTVLVTARDDPLLAQWQYGLGRSVAWTSDSTGRWATNWIAWPGFAKFFSQVVGWTFPGEEAGGIEASFEVKDGRTTLHVQSVQPDGSPRDFYTTSAVLVGPDLEPVEAELDQVAPGVYEKDLGAIASGAYAVRITQIRPGYGSLGQDGRAGSSDRRGIPAPRRESAAARDPSRGDERTGDHDATPAVASRPAADVLVHRALAVAPDLGTAAMAVRHRPSPSLARPSRIGGREGLARSHLAPARGSGPAVNGRHGDAGRPGSGCRRCGKGRPAPPAHPGRLIDRRRRRRASADDRTFERRAAG